MWATLLTLAACGEEPAVDADGDGTPKSKDCNDEAKSIYPGAPETPYDGIDQDCDGGDLIDVDGDGAPGGQGGTDCDDQNAAIGPHAAEIWYDGVDQDCDEASDNDQDGDGFDSEDHGGQDCDDTDATLNLDDVDKDGFTTCAGDCHDDAKTAKPGGKRICGDDLDNNCDGEPDCSVSGEVGAEEGHGVFNGEDDPDSAGAMVGPAGDVNGDGVGDFLVGAPGRDSEAFPEAHGLVYVIAGPKSGVQPLQSQFATLKGEDHYIGSSGVGVGDVDGDGMGEVLLGISASYKDADFENGAVLMRAPSGNMKTTQGTYLVGERDQDEAGRAVSGAGDQDGDAVPDFLVAAPRFDPVVTDAGVVYLISGTVTDRTPLGEAMGKLAGTLEGERAGFSLSQSDFNGDAVHDVLVGAPAIGTGAAGSVYLAVGPLTGDRTLDTADASLRGVIGDNAGISIGSGDVDGDGKPDILVGAPRTDGIGIDSGMAYFLLGTAAAGEVDLATYATASFAGLAEDDLAGASVDVGDLDGDGNEDLAIASPGAREGRGVVHLFYGAPTGVVDLNQADGLIFGEEKDSLGAAMSFVGDTSKDGFDDLVLGAPDHKVQFSKIGRAYLFLGGTM